MINKLLKIKSDKQPLSFFLFLFFVCIISIVKIISVYHGIPNRDSGFLLYLGQNINHGLVPYKDIWDHKPFLPYYINSFGYFFSPNLRQGVWVIEFISLLLFSFFNFSLLKKFFNPISALITTSLCILTIIPLVADGNLNEEYALPLNMIALFLFAKLPNVKYKFLYYLEIGFLSGTVILIKQNVIGVFAAIILYELFQTIFSNRKRILHVLFLVIGFIIPLSGGLFYVYISHSFPEFFDGTIIYNLSYSHTGIKDHIKSFIRGVNWTKGVLLLTFVGWIEIFFSVKKSTVSSQKLPLLHLAFIGIIIEIILTSLSGRDYPHYFTTWLPMASILAAYGLDILQNKTILFSLQENKKNIISIPLRKLVYFLLVLVNIPTFLYFVTFSPVYSYQQTTLQTVQFLSKHSTNSDFVLVWGGDTEINFLSARKSPTKYAVQFPLYMPGYQKPYMINRFLHDISTTKPKYIVFTYEHFDVKKLFDPKTRATIHVGLEDSYLPQMQEVYNYIEKNYHFVLKIGEDQWTIYEGNKK